jgi:hypothetical protein
MMRFPLLYFYQEGRTSRFSGHNSSPSTPNKSFSSLKYRSWKWLYAQSKIMSIGVDIGMKKYIEVKFHKSDLPHIFCHFSRELCHFSVFFHFLGKINMTYLWIVTISPYLHQIVMPKQNNTSKVQENIMSKSWLYLRTWHFFDFLLVLFVT